MTKTQSSGAHSEAPRAEAPAAAPGATVPAVFAGVPAGRVSFTPVPDVLFSEVLPAIEDPAELKVTLHVLWRLQRRSGPDRVVSGAALAADGLLMKGLGALGLDPATALARGLDLAVTRGTLLRLCGREASPSACGEAGALAAWYVLNSPRGRDYVARLRAGRARLPDGSELLEERPARALPTVFALYEQNIGPLQPIIAEELDEAQRSYPAEWIEDAFRVAAENNARNWRYVRAVLDRWRREGRDSDEDSGRAGHRRYIRGEYEEYRRG